MALPQQVQAELEAAERLEQQLAQGSEAPAGQQSPPEDPKPAPAAPAEGQPVVQPEPQPAPQDDWKRRYQILQGKYDAEVPQLHQTVKQLTESLRHTQELIARQQSQTPPEPKKRESLVTPKDEETFGADLVDLARRVTREESRVVLERLESLEQLVRDMRPSVDKVGQVAKEVAMSRQEMFNADLLRLVPDWQTVNVDEKWLAWLAEYDPMAGAIRQAALDAAAGSLDAKRVAAIFNAFKAQNPPAPNPQDQAQAELARQVAPGRSATASAAPRGEKTFTGVEYQYWADPRRVHDTPKDKLEQMLALLSTAEAEGRIRW